LVTPSKGKYKKGSDDKGVPRVLTGLNFQCQQLDGCKEGHSWVPDIQAQRHI
jgi:hypothetical protein